MSEPLQIIAFLWPHGCGKGGRFTFYHDSSGAMVADLQEGRRMVGPEGALADVVVFQRGSEPFRFDAPPWVLK